MNKLSLILTIILCCRIGLSQENKNVKFSVGNFHELTDRKFNWEEWETPMDTTIKRKEIAKYKGEEKINFQHPGSYDEEEGPNYFDLYLSEIHFLDYNGDGVLDFVYESLLGYTGHSVKFFKGGNSTYAYDFELSGKLEDFYKDKATNALGFVIYRYPCCDGYVHYILKYLPEIAEDEVEYRMSKMMVYMQSNISRVKNVPPEFQTSDSITLIRESAAYYHDRKPVYKKFDASRTDTAKHSEFHPFVIFPANSKGVVLARKKTDPETFCFVAFDPGTEPTEAIQMLTRYSSRPVKNRPEKIQVTYLGWIPLKNMVVVD